MANNTTTLYISNIEALYDNVLFDRAYDIVSQDRKNKVDSYRYHKDKCLSLGAELLLRKALRDRGIDNEKLEFAYTNYGKPYLPEHFFIHYNISHSGNYVICAISDEEVGCDIELIKDINLDIAKMFFTKNENEKIQALRTEKEKCDLFYRYWVLKESFIKLIGKGLNKPLNEFEIVIKGKKIYPLDKKEIQKCYFDEITIDGYKCSICRFSNTKLDIKNVDIAPLVL